MSLVHGGERKGGGETGGGRKKSEFKCCGLRGPRVKGCFSSSAACVGPLGKWRGWWRAVG